MPVAPLRYCAEPTCKALVPSGRCQAHRQAKDRDRGTRQQRGYDDNWLAFSKRRLVEHSLCVGYPLGIHGNLPAMAKVTDHIDGHSRPDDRETWYDEARLQSLCYECHRRKTNELEGGFGR